MFNYNGSWLVKKVTIFQQQSQKKDYKGSMQEGVNEILERWIPKTTGYE